MKYDAIVVGGSFAGLSAAMQLVRTRRNILLIDAGRPRNRFAEASHGFLGQDGVAPAEIRRRVLAQLARYPNFTLLEGEADTAERCLGRFKVGIGGGRVDEASVLVLALGVADTLPEIPGLAERWGRTVLHCPYCHGYEIGGSPIGILASSPLAAHQGGLLPDWGQTTMFIEPGVVFEEEHHAMLLARGVTIETGRVVGLIGEGQALEGVRLADGRVVQVHALFAQSKVAIASPLASQLGLELEEGPQGMHIKVQMGSTSLPGVFAAGDAASPMHNATLASASGVMAGISAHRALIEASLWK
ncbi:thioredoxin reductase [Rhizobium sp. Root274]|uniref:NAD(P)/FAD-dependent oxidoreductase n=1 Tax=unclassified Rhizobium TaxID=2613769 RepID=UPI0007128689|nr:MULTISPECIES: NAD(P)/FAD-dependent oxidoreductase [unclassified Rhizobium]KQW31675.1 thioredoxin reductase [Rhizobium sp. Root1240]KRD33216.1 thioredoxin reductase [Rhizobium sp. Root274]